MFPPIPPTDGLHPIVVHFPIALLLVAPLFMVLAAAQKRAGGMAAAALVLVLLGAAFTFLAAWTGEMAEDQAEAVAASKATLERHEDLGGLARFVFAGLGVLYAGLVGFGVASKDKLKRPLWVGVHAAYLVVYAGGCLLLANVAHDGGRLVHEFGVRAPIAAGGAGPGLPAGDAGEDD